jgi:HAD superfamily hydrolase (TIGR01509 family)
VLVDSGPVHQAAWRALFAPFGQDFGPDRYVAEAAGRSRDAVITAVLGPDVDLPGLMERKAALVRERLAQGGASPIPGAATLLREAPRRGLALAIATSSRMPEAFLAAAGLDGLVPIIVDRDDVSAGKPAPDLFLEAARRLGLPPAACVVVEDAMVGIHAAHAAGCRVIALTTTATRADLVDADCIIDKLEQLWEALDELATGTA